jgi:hypothetical protein
MAAQCPSVTVLVKLRKSLSSEMLAAFSPHSLILTRTTPVSTRARDFVGQFAVSELRPLFPEFTEARLLKGLSDVDAAGRVRARFPERARCAACRWRGQAAGSC